MARILLVEDDHVLANTLIDWLEFQGHETEHVGNGARALEKIAAPAYDVIVLDWNLPDVTGIEICKQYRAEGGSLPVLMLTGRHGSSEEAQCKEAGANKYLAKPFHLEELTRELGNLLAVDV